jgi:hypothetical protein
MSPVTCFAVAAMPMTAVLSAGNPNRNAASRAVVAQPVSPDSCQCSFGYMRREFGLRHRVSLTLAGTEDSVVDDRL